MTEDQARRVGELLVGLERLVLELGWRWDGEVWVKPEAEVKTKAEAKP